MSPFHCIGAALAATMVLMAGTAVGQAGVGQVTAASASSLRVYTQAGQPTGERVDRATLRFPLAIVEAKPSGLIGVQVGGEVKYFRGLDLTFRLNGPPGEICTPLVVAGRTSGSVSAGSSAGSGGSADCRPANTR